MWLLAKTLAIITGHSRQRVVPGIDFEWAHNSWTHNIFRVYELIFWRRFGIRAEMSSMIYEGKVIHAAHSWEAMFALIEQTMREGLRSLKGARIYIPVLQTPQGIPVFASPYLFAVALDTTFRSTVAASPFSYNYTCTGSNLMLFCLNTFGTSITSVTYNSVSMGTALATQVATGGATNLSLYNLASPSTGTNSMTVTYTGSLFNSYGASYTGVTSTIDSHNSATASATATFSPSTTVVASNCWLIAGGAGSSNFATTTVTAPAVMRQIDTGDDGLSDSGTTVGTSSQSITYNNPSQNWTGVIASFAPSAAAATVVVTPTLPFMHAG